MKKHKNTSRILNSLAVVMIILALVLLYTHIFLDPTSITKPYDISHSASDVPAALRYIPEGISKAQKVYYEFKYKVEDIEKYIASVGDPWIFVMILLAIFLGKSIVSLVPISITCLMSGLVFSFPKALAVNVAGIIILMTVKYWWGYKFNNGGYWATKIMNRYPNIKALLSYEGQPNPWVLFIFRLVPGFPVNAISQLYGSMKFDYRRYMFVSIAGFSIKMISFTCIGCNVSNPFSAAFVVPLIVILFVSGFGILDVNFFVNRIIAKNESKKQSVVPEENNADKK